MALVSIKGFTNIPVSALGSSTRRILARQLNPPKQTVSSDGISQDKEGLADLMGYQYSDIQNYAMKTDFTMSLLEDWSTKQGSTIALLWDYLEQMERHDLLEDEMLIKRIEKDVTNFQHRQETEKSLMMGQPVQVPEVESSEPPRSEANDHHWDQFRNITIGEAYCHYCEEHPDTFPSEQRWCSLCTLRSHRFVIICRYRPISEFNERDLLWILTLVYCAVMTFFAVPLLLKVCQKTVEELPTYHSLPDVKVGAWITSSSLPCQLPDRSLVKI